MGYTRSSEIATQAQTEWKVVEAQLRQAVWAEKEQQRALKQTGLDLLDEQSGLERINRAKTTLTALAGENLDSSDVESITEERGSAKSVSKVNCVATQSKEGLVEAS